MHRRLVVISLLVGSISFGQTQKVKIDVLPYHQAFDHMHYRNQIERSAIYMNDSKKVHSSIRPAITLQNDPEKSKFFYSRGSVRNDKPTYFSVYPISDIGGGIEIGSSTLPLYTGGIGAGIDLSSNKFILTAKGLPYYTSLGWRRDSIYNLFDQDIGTNRALTTDVFYRTELLMAYQANKFFTLYGGYGKNFFGEGYRSLLLSDNAAAHPFFKIETHFAGIKYVNLYSVWKDNSINPANRTLDVMKFNASHYLSWNITRDFNLSVFETVIWSGNDTLVNRGFDINYLNPVVFYRPVEYGLGSSDNVLIGANMSYKLNEHHNFYFQFILDEFLLSEIKARSRWWANKFGGQIGYKSNAFLHDSLYFQIEFNGVRPFTYSHKSSEHSYGNLNAPVAHPLGANFFELLNIVSYKSNKHRLTNKITFASFGADQDSLSYGQDIFKSYTLRPGNFDQFMMQGTRTNVLNETIIYEYALIPEINMYLTAGYNWRMQYTNSHIQNFHSFTVGLRSRIWNSYNDL